MSTGDGLLARVTPSSPISLDAFVSLCEAGQAHGNGIMEVTQRGSLQIRGLSPTSAPTFARVVAALKPADGGMLADEGMPPVLTSPLLGLDPGERIDLRALAPDLLDALRHRVDMASLGPKVSVLIDGGGRLHMDEVTADLRLRAGNGPAIHLSIAGRAQDSTSLGWLDPRYAIEAIIRVLTAIGHRGPDARAKDFSNADDAQALRLSLADILCAAPVTAPATSPRAELIGTHRLNNGTIARGFALPFGYSEAQALRRLALAAAHCGAASIRPAPGRVLLVIGLPISAMEELVAAAAGEQLIVQPDDARRHVVACAGAPACNSAMLSTRQLAAQVAEAAGPILDGSITIHLSGCTKGCAHPGAAGLTLVGPDRLVVQGRASDAPQARISPTDFIAGLRGLHPERDGSLAALLREPHFVSRLRKGRPPEPAHGELERD
jgi:precorrin-3B synthase